MRSSSRATSPSRWAPAASWPSPTVRGAAAAAPRNRHVAEVLWESGLATLLLDLLTGNEETVDLRTAKLRFDIRLLGERVVRVVDWLSEGETTRTLAVGLFGASTGAAAALVAAAERPQVVQAVVSRGGRPDLAAGALARVRAPTLLIVGGRDPEVLQLNRLALAQLGSESHLEVVPGATHLFEETGALEQVTQLAADWFVRHLLAE